MKAPPERLLSNRHLKSKIKPKINKTAALGFMHEISYLLTDNLLRI